MNRCPEEGSQQKNQLPLTPLGVTGAAGGHFQHCWRVTGLIADLPGRSGTAAAAGGAATAAEQECPINPFPKSPFSCLLLGQEDRQKGTDRRHQTPFPEEAPGSRSPLLGIRLKFRAVWSFPRTLFILRKSALQASITGWQLCHGS